MSVEEFFTGQRELWEFWLFFGDLPEGSRTKTAIAMDPEIAEARSEAVSEEEIASLYEARAGKGPRQELTPRGYTLEVEKLNQVLDAINALQLVVRQLTSGKVKESDFKPAQRPKTEFDKRIDERIKAYEKKYQEGVMAEFGF